MARYRLARIKGLKGLFGGKSKKKKAREAAEEARAAAGCGSCGAGRRLSPRRLAGYSRRIARSSRHWTVTEDFNRLA